MNNPAEFPDSRLKYIEMPKEFSNRANDINLTCRQHQRICTQLAARLAKENPKTSQEFEKVEYYKNFVIKTSQLNDQVLDILDYTQCLLNEIAADSSLLNDAEKKDVLRIQSETIEHLLAQSKVNAHEIFLSRRNQIATK